MKVEYGRVVSFHYTLYESGEQLESSREGGAPLIYLHGVRNIIAGLEQAMEGRSVGDEFSVTIEPKMAYGERQDANLQRISAKQFRNPARLVPGQVVQMQTPKGPLKVTVVKVGRFNVDIDANHPMAGKTLTFDIEITDIRDATAEETSHGHAHGVGGVEH